MGDLEASRAITHFVRAGEYDSAALVLLRGLVAIREVDLPPGVRPIFAQMWMGLPLPQEINLGLRLMIRSLQLGLAVRSGLDVLYIREDLERLLSGVGEADQWAAFTATMFAANALSTVDVAAAGRHLIRALRLRPAMTAELKDKGISAPEMPLEQMVWMLAPGVQSPDALFAWVDTLEQMTADERAQAFDGDVGRQGAENIANRLMFSEAEKPEADRDWGAVLQCLGSLTERARAIGIHLLADAAIIARMVINGEHLNDLPAAEALSEEMLAGPGPDPDASFLVTNTRALLLYDYGPADRASDWLTRAFALRTPTYGWRSVRAGIYLSIRLAESDPSAAVEVLAAAVRFADEHADEVGLSRLEAYGELGVAKWFTGDLLSAFRTWDRAATLLSEAKEDSPAWRSLFVLFGHITGYFASVASTGRPPAAFEGGEPYAAPTRGLFILRPPGRDEAYSEERSGALPVQLVLFGEAVGARAEAAGWARMAVEQGRAENSYEFLLLSLPVLLVDALEADDYEQALGLAWEHGAIQGASLHRGTRDRAGRLPPPTEVLGPEGGDSWLAAEAAAMLVLVPIYLHLALLARRSREEARTRVPALIRAMRKSAARSADPPAWHAAVELFDAIFVADASDPELVARANGYAFRNADMAGRLQIVAYLAASTRPGTVHDRSIALQLAVAVGLLVLPDTRAFRELAGEFVGHFWQERFENARFRFSNPRDVEHLLRYAAGSGPDRARLTLAAVAAGLGAEVRPDVREWLNGPKQ